MQPLRPSSPGSSAKPTPESIMRNLDSGRRKEARAELKALLAAKPRDPAGWLCSAWIEQSAGNWKLVRESAERAAKFGAPAVPCNVLLSTAANQLGFVDLGIELAERAVAAATTPPDRLFAEAALSEALFYAHRHPELGALLERSTELRQDPRGQLMLARVRRKQGDLPEAERIMRALLESNASAKVRRMAGFELAKMLDQQKRFADAWAAAKATHAATSVPYDTGGMLAGLEATAKLAARGAFKKLVPAAGTLPPTALICALPRSGTTLIEQMLDRHPKVAGIGELPEVGNMAPTFTALGGWPEGVLNATQADLMKVRNSYLEAARTMRGLPADVMALDKNLFTWLRLPAIAATLPGAKLIRLRRDPRDTAVSLFMNSMSPSAMGWTASLADIKRVVKAERELIPGILEALALPVVDLRYEEFIAQPRGHLQRLLEFLGLPWHEECLAPEQNRRVVLTLSHEQVLRPINTDSLDRWKNYADQFDPSWEALNI